MIYAILKRWVEEGVQGLPDKSHANTSKPGVDLPTRNIIRKKQEENPLLGEFRMYAALKQRGISVSPRTCGRIMAENRRLYAIKPKPGEPHKPKPHPFKATARHERWCLDIRYIEKRLMRAPQLYSRVGFAHEMEPLSDDETRDFLEKRWGHRVKPSSDDFTDKEAVATILRITRGNIRLIERLMLQVERVLIANHMHIVTKDVVETAQKNLIIGLD